MILLSKAKHALTLNLKRFTSRHWAIQYNVNTDPYTVYSSTARMRLRRLCPLETNLLKFFHMLCINFQLLKNKRRHSQTQGDVSDWPLPN